MNLRPLANRIVVKPLEQEEKTPGGIIVPDTAKEKPMRGEVIAVGPGNRNEQGKRIEMDLKKGDIVIYGKYSGTDFKIGEQDYLILSDSDVLAILE